MKGETTIDFGAGRVRLDIALERIEDAGAAMEMIRNAARACWPTIMFNDETLDKGADEHESFETPQGFETPAEVAKPFPAKSSPAGRPRDYSRPVRPGSLSFSVVEACRRLGTTDFVAIADALDLKTNIAAALIANLKRGGHLENLNSN